MAQRMRNNETRAEEYNLASTDIYMYAAPLFTCFVDYN